MGRLKLRSVTAFVALIAAIQLASAAPVDQQAAAINRGVVELETSGAAGISVRIAEDLANLIDDGATRRVVPVVGKGSLQTLTDLRYLRGIDMALCGGRDADDRDPLSQRDDRGRSRRPSNGREQSDMSEELAASSSLVTLGPLTALSRSP